LRGSKTSYDVLRDTKTSQFHPIIPDDLIPEKARLGFTLTQKLLQTHDSADVHYLCYNNAWNFPDIV